MTKADVLAFWRRYARNRAALVALAVLVAIVIVAIVGPHLLQQRSPFELAYERIQRIVGVMRRAKLAYRDVRFDLEPKIETMDLKRMDWLAAHPAAKIEAPSERSSMTRD